jgi:hypothetical protein
VEFLAVFPTQIFFKVFFEFWGFMPGLPVFFSLAHGFPPSGFINLPGQACVPDLPGGIICAISRKCAMENFFLFCLKSTI